MVLLPSVFSFPDVWEGARYKVLRQRAAQQIEDLRQMYRVMKSSWILLLKILWLSATENDSALLKQRGFLIDKVGSAQRIG